MATKIAKKEDSLPAGLMEDMLADAGDGVEYTTEELTIPRIQLVQALSPELKKTDPKFIEGISAGDVFNTVTREMYAGEDGVNVVVAYQSTKYNEWVFRDQGGGFVQELAADSRDVKEATRDGARETLPNGNELVKTDENYVLVETENGWSPAIISMVKTQLKVSRRWKTQILMQTVKVKGESKRLPLYGTIWNLKSVEETNKNNESYYNWTVEKVGIVDDPVLYKEAKTFRQSVSDGEVKTAPDQDTGVPPDSSVSDDSIPF
jgi:hypothetical protein